MGAIQGLVRFLVFKLIQSIDDKNDRTMCCGASQPQGKCFNNFLGIHIDIILFLAGYT